MSRDCHLPICKPHLFPQGLDNVRFTNEAGVIDVHCHHYVLCHEEVREKVEKKSLIELIWHLSDIHIDNPNEYRYQKSCQRFIYLI
jgi:hypothetical protein